MLLTSVPVATTTPAAERAWRRWALRASEGEGGHFQRTSFAHDYLRVHLSLSAQQRADSSERTAGVSGQQPGLRRSPAAAVVLLRRRLLLRLGLRRSSGGPHTAEINAERVTLSL